MIAEHVWKNRLLILERAAFNMNWQVIIVIKNSVIRAHPVGEGDSSGRARSAPGRYIPVRVIAGEAEPSMQMTAVSLSFCLPLTCQDLTGSWQGSRHQGEPCHVRINPLLSWSPLTVLIITPPSLAPSLSPVPLEHTAIPGDRRWNEFISSRCCTPYLIQKTTE